MVRVRAPTMQNSYLSLDTLAKVTSRLRKIAHPKYTMILTLGQQLLSAVDEGSRRILEVFSLIFLVSYKLKKLKKGLFFMENISQLAKLQQLQVELKENSGQSNLDNFENLVGVYLGVEPKIHYPKLKDQDGNKVKDDKGNDMRSEISDGWTYTFNEFGTSKQIKVVLKKQINFKLLTAYSISGKGYDIKSGGMYFLEVDTKVANY